MKVFQLNNIYDLLLFLFFLSTKGINADVSNSQNFEPRKKIEKQINLSLL